MVYDIWMEGFHIQGGGPTPASFVGQSEGASFEEAVKKWYSDPKHFPSEFNPDTLSYWGCRLFDNEKDARRFMG